MFIGPLDFWDTLAATDWNGRFESFDAEPLWALRRYSELAHELGRSSFFSQPINFAFGMSAEESYQRLEHAGRDSLRSMTMSFRQLWAQNEPARFQTIRNLLRTRALPPHDGVDVVGLLDVLGQRYKAAARTVAMKHVWEHDLMGEPKALFRADQVIDDWFYGGQFHADKAKGERVKQWSTTSYEFTLIKAISGLVHVMWELQIVVIGVANKQAAVAA